MYALSVATNLKLLGQFGVVLPPSHALYHRAVLNIHLGKTPKLELRRQTTSKTALIFSLAFSCICSGVSLVASMLAIQLQTAVQLNDGL